MTLAVQPLSVGVGSVYSIADRLIVAAPSAVAPSAPAHPPTGGGMTLTLERPTDQPITARLAGAGSMRDELAAVLDAAPRDATAADYRRLILDENAAAKRSATARMWAWKRLKLRYALDATSSREYMAFRSAYDRATSAADRNLVVGLMLARTDRLFRETTLALVSPLLRADAAGIEPSDVTADVDSRRQLAGLEWSAETLRSLTNHLVSSWRDVGLIANGRGIVTRAVSAGPIVVAFAAALGQTEGLTDRAILRSSWFELLGADEARAVELLRGAAAAGVLTFKFQADVVEIRLSHQAGSAA